MFYIYVLQSIKDKSFYVGYTTDLRKRFAEHNHGMNVSTKNRIPWKIIFYEAYRNRDDAERREKYLKTNQGARILKRMLKEYFYENRKVET